MREQPFVDRMFIFNVIQNQNELDDYAVDAMQFYIVGTLVCLSATEQARENHETSHCRSITGCSSH